MRRTLLCALVAASVCAAAPRLIYKKSFPGSVPDYVEITVDKDGATVYKEAPDDNNPIAIKLLPADSEAMFTLADKLDHFAKPIESPLKVAFMGKKTFRYEDGESHEVQFNYSQDPNATLLLDWFERIAETERGYIELERTVKYDKLGVHNALILIQTSRERQRLVFPQQFLPLLDRVAKNESFMHIARERAASFADAIRAEMAAPAAASGGK